jgi:hypothetical protein
MNTDYNAETFVGENKHPGTGEIQRSRLSVELRAARTDGDQSSV